MDKVYDQKKECYGCSACMNICPVSAIRMKQDKEGFFYPVIDHEKSVPNVILQLSIRTKMLSQKVLPAECSLRFLIAFLRTMV